MSFYAGTAFGRRFRVYGSGFMAYDDDDDDGDDDDDDEDEDDNDDDGLGDQVSQKIPTMVGICQ